MTQLDKAIDVMRRHGVSREVIAKVREESAQPLRSFPRAVTRRILALTTKVGDAVRVVRVGKKPHYRVLTIAGYEALVKNAHHARAHKENKNNGTH
ncbi:MAG: hypothetical protein WC822_02475 [Candidatus Paceibacterota bacterium]|jgi:hypothetical protein